MSTVQKSTFCVDGIGTIEVPLADASYEFLCSGISDDYEGNHKNQTNESKHGLQQQQKDSKQTRNRNHQLIESNMIQD